MIAGHCYDIDGQLWHQPGECSMGGCKCCARCDYTSELGRCIEEAGHPGLSHVMKRVSLDEFKRGVLAKMEELEPGSSQTSRCPNCGDTFFVNDEKTRLPCCDSDCYDAYGAYVQSC